MSAVYTTHSLTTSLLDCEAQLSRIRSRLRTLNTLKASAPTTTEDDAVILRKKLRGLGTPATSSHANLETSDIYDRVVRTFNLSYKKGLALARENGFCRTGPLTASFLLNTVGLSRIEIGKVLGTYDARGLECLSAFTDGCGFEGLPFLQALRLFLTKFKLPGEPEMVDRIVEAFAKSYKRANPSDPDTGLLTEDNIYGLGFAVIMLNTDMYSKSLKKKDMMSRIDFVRNTRFLDTTNFTDEFLGKIYDEIKRKEIMMSSSLHDTHGSLFSDVLKSGYIKKQSDTPPYQYQTRYMILTAKPAMLYYFKDKSDVDPTGYIPLEANQVKCEKIDNSKKGFTLLPTQMSGGYVKSVKYGRDRTLQQGQHSKFKFKGESMEDAWEWIRLISVQARGDGLEAGSSAAGSSVNGSESGGE
jgi:hypothetical protein